MYMYLTYDTAYIYIYAIYSLKGISKMTNCHKNTKTL